VFLDTVGLLAVWDKADQWHKDAEPVFLQLVTSGRPILAFVEESDR
jgi:predicted nucleic acid-binding protein